MKTMLNICLVSLLTISVCTSFAASIDGDSKSVENEMTEKILEKSLLILDKVMQDPEKGIPQRLIAESEGIVIFPGACQVVPGAYNGQEGRGIAMIQNADGSWSNPIFVSLSKNLKCIIL